jgi:hypothetical protein
MTKPQMTTASWVIVDRATGKAIWETWSHKIADNVRRADHADVVPIGEWLARVNAGAKEAAR